MRNRNALSWLLGVLAFAIIVSARICFISRYGSSLPYWDQWADEAGLLYRSWVGDHFDWSLLWRAHNEHRILVSRIWALLLFAGNQEQWDPMVQAMAGSGFVALSLAAAIAWCSRNFAVPEFVPVAAGVLAMAILPNGWGNALVGFQSCFHFVLVFSLLAIIGAATSRIRPASILLVLLASVAASLSLASGLTTFPVIVFVLAIRLLTASLSFRDASRIGIPLALVFFVGLYFTPVVQDLDAARAADGQDFLRSLSVAASWPFAAPWGVLMWLPFLAWLWRTAKTRVASPPDIAMAGIAAWAALTCVGIAYSRGHQLSSIESRYTDLVAFGAIANSYFAVRWFALWQYRKSHVVQAVSAVLASAAVLYGLEARSRSYIYDLTEWSGRTQVAASNVSRFLLGDEHALEGKPQQYIPVPSFNAEDLGSLLQVPEIRRFLPFSLLDPLDPRIAGRSRFCHWLPDEGIHDLPWKGRLTCGDVPGSASSVPVGPLSAAAYSAWSVLATGWMNVMIRSDAALSEGSALRCSLETVNDEASANVEFAATYSAAVKLSGWIGPRAGKPIRLWLTAENGDRFETTFRSLVPRPDVAAYLEDEGLADSGYRVWIDASTIPPGSYRVSADVADSGACETGRTFVIGGAPDPRLAY